MAKLSIVVAAKLSDQPSLVEQLDVTERRALNEWVWDRLESGQNVVDPLAWPGWPKAVRRIESAAHAAWEQATDAIERIRSYGRY